ncbi:hypothetical protein J4447_03125 [Candidatus Pacearchaeota archaeon]|nr:hypothetical protein [Candidatus Pacearchaeota archaeon]
MKEKILNALKELRAEGKRNFEQTADLIINLKKFDVRKESVNISVPLPHKFRDYKIAAFLENKSSVIDTIKKDELRKLTDKKAIKNLLKKYDYFMAQASLMPEIAKTLGKYLGPGGKMPAPGRGVVMSDDENTIKKELAKFEGSLRIKTKEPSIKLVIGRESMNDEEIAENIEAVYKAILPLLAKGKENIKNVMLKFSMSKPRKIVLS